MFVPEAPQAIPVGFDVSLPNFLFEALDVSITSVVSTNCCCAVAVTSLPELVVTLHVPVPLQNSPDHPVNLQVEFELAVNTTLVPSGNILLHVEPQFIPEGLDETTSEVHVPAFLIDKLLTLTNLAVTDLAELIVTEHVAVVLVHPVQPLNM